MNAVGWVGVILAAAVASTAWILAVDGPARFLGIGLLAAAFAATIASGIRRD